MPVVVMTAAELTDDDRAALSGGAATVLAKPAHAIEELPIELRGLLQRMGGSNRCLGSSTSKTTTTTCSCSADGSSRRGYEILVASDGESGIEVAQSEQPDLILMDLGLPGNRRMGDDAAA